MTISLPFDPSSLEKIISLNDGKCLIINRKNNGVLKLGNGLDSVGDVIAVVHETDDYEKCMDDRACIWAISYGKHGYYLKNERDPGSEFYLFRGADRDDSGDYTIYGESEWHDDRKYRTEFNFRHKPIFHGSSLPPEPLSYYIEVSDDSFYGKDYYLKSGVSKDRWDCHQVYAAPQMLDDDRDLWFLVVI